MSIIKKPAIKAPSVEVEKFIEGAPDGSKGKATIEKKDGVQITLRMSKEQLDRISTIAKRQGIPRASYIKRAVFIQLEADEKA
jgi:predicted DNA binding CopG/RHH family protein